jgi:hypothetical protein
MLCVAKLEECLQYAGGAPAGPLLDLAVTLLGPDQLLDGQRGPRVRRAVRCRPRWLLSVVFGQFGTGLVCVTTIGR